MPSAGQPRNTYGYLVFELEIEPGSGRHSPVAIIRLRASKAREIIRAFATDSASRAAWES